MPARKPYPTRLPAEFYVESDDFIDNYIDVKPGHHFSAIGPNGGGKTHFLMRLMGKLHELHPETRGVMLMMKPDKGPKDAPRGTTGDPAVSRLARSLKAPITRSWPPNAGQKALHPRDETPFWVHWPKHSDSFRADKVRHRDEFERALLDAYNRGRTYVFADEVFSLTNTYRLGDVLEHLWSKARSMETSLIGATQRPAGVPRWMYSSARHLLLYRDNDREARKRYADISGMDPARLLAITDGLRTFEMPRKPGQTEPDLVREALYVHPETETLAIVMPSGGRVTNRQIVRR